MSEITKEDFLNNEGKLFCIVCSKLVGEEIGICFECGSCKTCCKHEECKECGEIFNDNIFPLCSSCGKCDKCCKCIKCENCHKTVLKRDVIEGSSICIKCHIKVNTYLTSHLSDPSGTKQIEHKLMNFYALSEIQGQVLRAKNDEKHRDKLKVELCEVEDLEKELNPIFKDVTDTLAQLYFDYLYACCLGELGHLCRQTGCVVGVGGICRGEKNREFIISKSGMYEPEKSLRLIELFFEHKYWKDRGSFGGPSWANIARAGRMYFDPKIPKTVFLDHVVDLTHNGGLFLGKTNRWFTSFGGYYLKLLDLKRESSVFNSLAGLYVSSETERIVKKAKGLKLIEVNCKINKVTLAKHTGVVYGNKIIPVRSRHTYLTNRVRIERLMSECERYNPEKWEGFWEGITKDSWAIPKSELKKGKGVSVEEYDLLEEGVEPIEKAAVEDDFESDIDECEDDCGDDDD